MNTSFLGNDKIEYELKIELQKWQRSDTPKHVYCKASDISPPILNIVIGDFYNKKKIENLLQTDNDTKYDISTMPISNHSIDISPLNNNLISQKNDNITKKNNNKIEKLTNIVVERNESPAVQFIKNSSSYTPLTPTIPISNSKKPKEEPAELIIEKHSQHRIKTFPKQYNIIEKLLDPILYIPLHQLKGRDESRGWYTIGVIVGKSSRKKKDNTTYALIQLGNLKNVITNVFVFDNNLHKIKDKKIGQVLAICHAKTMIPEEKNSMIALNIAKESEIYTLGNSVDLCFCKEKRANGNPCNIPLDRRESTICENHIISKYKEFRNKRQEFANGNFRFTMSQSNSNILSKKMSGTYRFNNSTISTYHGKIKLDQHEKHEKKPVISEEDNKYLERLKQNNSYGINLLKKVGVTSKIEESNRSIEKKREEKILNIHPPEALLKMGIRAPMTKTLNTKGLMNIPKLGKDIKKGKDVIIDLEDHTDHHSTNKRKIEISFFSDDENEEDEKKHFKKFLEMKNKKRKSQDNLKT